MIPSPGTVARLRDETDVLDLLLHALAAGRTLPEVIGEAAKEHARRSLRPRLLEIEGVLRSGGTLGDALERARLSPALVAAARAGEASGRLAETLEAAEASVEARLELERRAADAWAQPLLALGVAAATIVLIALAGTLPGLLSLLEQPSRLVQMVHAVTSLPQPVPALLALGAIIVAVVTARRLTRTARFERLVERLPVAGGLRREQQQALALREASVMVSAGVPVQDALELAAAGLPAASATRRMLSALVGRVRGGHAAGMDAGWPLLSALLTTPPPQDELAALLARVAAWHEAEMDRLADAAAEAAAIVALLTSSVACGAIIILAWSGYFALASQAGG